MGKMEGLLDNCTYKSGWKPVKRENSSYNNEDYEKNNITHQEITDSKIARPENHIDIDSRNEYYSIAEIQKAFRAYESQLKDIMNKLTDINNNINNLHNIILSGVIAKDNGISTKKRRRFFNLYRKLF